MGYISPTLIPRGKIFGSEDQQKYFEQRREGLTKARDLFVSKYGLRKVTEVERGEYQGENVKAAAYVNGNTLFHL